MELITMKILTAGMLVSSALSTSVVPAPTAKPVNSYEIVSYATNLKAEANIDAKPAKIVAYASTIGETTQAKGNMANAKVSILKGPDKLNQWLDKLIQTESQGRTDIKILDVNDRYSYGCLQFQMPTFVAYGHKYGILSGNESNSNLESLIMDCSIQRAIARHMILDDTSNWRNWYNSVVMRVGYPPID